MLSVPITQRRFFFADPHYAVNWRDYEWVRSAIIGDEEQRTGGKNDAWQRQESDFCQQAHCLESQLIEKDLKG